MLHQILLRGFLHHKLQNVLASKVSFDLASYAPHSVSFSLKIVAKPVMDRTFKIHLYIKFFSVYCARYCGSSLLEL